MDMAHFEQVLQRAQAGRAETEDVSFRCRHSSLTACTAEEAARLAQAADIYDRVETWAHSQSNGASDEYEPAGVAHHARHAEPTRVFTPSVEAAQHPPVPQPAPQPDLDVAKQAAAAALQARVHAIQSKLSQLEPSMEHGSSAPAPPPTAVPLNQTGESLLQLLDKVADRLTRADADHRRLVAQVAELQVQVQQETKTRSALADHVAALEATMAQQAKQEQEDRLQQLTDDNRRLQEQQSQLQQQLE